jgi:hypothetical protein
MWANQFSVLSIGFFIYKWKWAWQSHHLPEVLCEVAEDNAGELLSRGAPGP